MAFKKKEDIAISLGNYTAPKGISLGSAQPVRGISLGQSVQPAQVNQPLQSSTLQYQGNVPSRPRTLTVQSYKPQQQEKPRSVVQNIQDFTARSNEKFLGGIVKGAADVVNQVGTGFNQQEADKRTSGFLKSIGQTGNQSLTKGTSATSAAGRAGAIAGNTQKFLTDTAAIVAPGAAATKGIQGLGAIQRLSNAGRLGKIGSEVASNVGGGLVSGGVSQALDPSQSVTQNLGQGVAIDAGLSLLGPGVAQASRFLRRARNGGRAVGEVIDDAEEIASRAGKSAEETREATRRLEDQRKQQDQKLNNPQPLGDEIYKYIKRQTPISTTFRSANGSTVSPQNNQPQMVTVRESKNTYQAPEMTDVNANRNIPVETPQMVKVTDTRIADDVQQADQVNNIINQARRQEARNAPLLQQDNGAVLPERNIADEITQAAQERKNRYAPSSLREKFGEAINPYRAGARIDARAAANQDVALRDLPKNQSLEAMAERTRNSGQEAEEYLRNSNIGSVVQKYGSDNPQSQEFNTYRTFMRDLEQRADGRPALYREYSDDDLANFVRDYETRNPDAPEELRALVQDIQNVQDQAVRRGVVDAETVERARTKKDGSRYEFYTPISRATPEELERATINANGVGSIGRQTIIQDMQGSDIPLDPSFGSLTDYVNNAYRQMAKAETSQLFAQRVREGVVPGARFTDTSENAAARKAMRDEQKATGVPKNMNNYAELRADPTTGLQVISGRENGSTFKIEVSPEQARFLQGLGEEQLNSVLKVAKTAQAPFRTVLTGALNLPFQAISAGFNAFMSPIISPQGFRVLAPRATLEAIKSFNSNADFQKILRNNGAQQFTGNLEARGKTTTADALAAERDFASKFKFNVTHPGKLWEKLDIPGSKIEGAQRTQIAKASYDARIRNAGNTPEGQAQAIADAVYAYNNVLPNFGRTSSAIRQIDSLAMYTGASVAGTRSLLTAVKRDPVGVSTRLGLATTALTGLTAYSMSQPEAQAFYEDMTNSGKGYILDNNGIVILPGAHKVTKEEATADPSKKEGEWLGVLKVPLPPEMRPVQHAIQAQILANAKGENIPIADYGQALFDFTTGSARTLANPGIDLVYGLATNVDRATGREIVPKELQRKPIEEQKYSTTSAAAQELSKVLGVSPLRIDYVLGKSGFPGQIAKGVNGDDPVGGAAGAAFGAVANRFTNTFGEKESTKFFNQVEEIAKSIPNDDDMKAFETLHADKGDGGKSLDKAAERYKTLLARPEVLNAERRLDAYSRQNGKPGNPLFDLSPEQQEKVFRYRASKDLNSAKQAYSKDGTPLYVALGLDEKWYDNFKNAESKFYSAVSKSNDNDASTAVLSYSGAKQPQPNGQLQQKLDTYYSLPSGTGVRSKFLSNNPDVLEHWAAGDRFTNAERIAVGLEPLSDDEDSDNNKSGNATGKGRGTRFARNGSGGNPNKLYIRSSEYDGTIDVDNAPSAKVSVTNEKPKIKVKPRQKRNVKVTSTKVKS